MCGRLLLSAAILAWWWQPVASVVALNLLYWVMRLVLYQGIAMAIKTTRECGIVPFVDFCFVYCDPGSHWGNTEQVAAQWRHPVASNMALDILHWVMPHELLQCLHMAIKMACN
jgi:hypothetical protein